MVMEVSAMLVASTTLRAPKHQGMEEDGHQQGAPTRGKHDHWRARARACRGWSAQQGLPLTSCSTCAPCAYGLLVRTWWWRPKYHLLLCQGQCAVAGLHPHALNDLGRRQ